VIKIERGAPQGMFLLQGGKKVSWISKLQKVVALSKTKVEYVAVT
jgi:hypothetical protein